MNEEWNRYHCQIALPGFGPEGQKRLQSAAVLIVGAGGLGCPSAQYLAAAGIGTIGIADDDVVAESNLHRQILYAPQDVGLPKAATAVKRLQQQNPSVTFNTHPVRVTSSNVMELIAGYDLVLEGTDNFETKCLLNDACVLSGKPLVYGAIYQYEGQVSVWNVLQADGSRSPNYRDVFPGAESAQVPNCAEGGVIPTLAGIVGSMQANEAIKYFTGSGELLCGKLWIMNVLDGRSRIIQLKRTGARVDRLPETIEAITFEQLQRRFKQYTLVDVRSLQEHVAFNIGGINIPLDVLESRVHQLDPAHPIVCYCATAKRSTAAAFIIRDRLPGTTIYVLKSGVGNMQAHPSGISKM
ncbi:HesA/MoeB/ThiF family protein [Niabella pedocola]|uniref:HesA/MoeB/ThiF family protein n=1 Tax=Niabella pedocola TaxID=1752077 RepID=A0ABS8PJX0_9BACT|nr:HesA/MoeB/ThiF family protein [Niabella pedocola]MCD2421407.1 HesA/MoeB/ThiF family protein [Niabella pedocola]